MENLIEKWDKIFVLNTIKDEVLKLKVASAYELCAKILLDKHCSNNLTTEVVFPAIYRLLVGNIITWGDVALKLPDSYMFDEENMLKLINYLNDCLNLSNLSNHIDYKKIDIEAESLIFLCTLYLKHITRLS
jgi:hypothetical protein